MHRHILRLQGDDLIHRFAKSFDAVAGEACNQVHVDVVKSHPACHLKAVDDLPGGVPTPDFLQHLIVECLRIDADAGDVVPAQHPQLLLVDGVRSSCLHRVFLQLGKVEVLFHCAADLVKLLGREDGRCAAAKINGGQAQSGPLYLLGNLLELLTQPVDIHRQDVLSAFAGDVVGNKGAVAAPRRAKWNGDIQAKGVVGYLSQDGRLVACRFQRQLNLFLCHIKMLFKFPCHHLWCFALVQSAVEQLDRTNAGHHSPRRMDAGRL